MSLVDVVHPPGVREEELLRLGGALEDASEHPVAVAVAAAARDRVGDLPPVERFAATQGRSLRRRREQRLLHEVLAGIELAVSADQHGETLRPDAGLPGRLGPPE
jgi:cation transport ATPase